MFLGSVIKQRREELHLTQTQLSSGITTQATISELENKNSAPTIKILVAICKRLNLTLNDVVSDFNVHRADDVIQKLNLAEKYSRSLKPDKVKEVIDSIDTKDLSTDEATAFYYFLKGNIALIIDQDFDDAQFYYNLVLNAQDKNNPSIYVILAETSIGISYFRKDDSQKAKYYLDKAFHDIMTGDLNLQNNLSRVQFALTNIGNYYSKIKEFELSKTVLEYGIQLNREFGSINSLDYFYHLLAYDLIQEDPNNLEQAIYYAKIAVSMAEHLKNDYMVEHSSYFVEHKKFLPDVK
ncbi:XRE family transcriptional regulator [Periweissella cryptocerci]|uniref:XRE family transcriptional regulator n=1 Tax=Periweissella cryptocerci TaxID=2506420 RepID=A0A4P6YS08_9LACO|nr:helix-turn-helix transcriptional regulator [Periweissella cryptocerci]QBO35454.1 XRE family transcriptional regulator [Periweissella cryptocerci]